MADDRHIPTIMATQHPDSASRYVPVQEEVEEAINYFLDGWAEGLNYDEYKVDYEGKLTPYHQVSQIVLRAVEVGLKPGVDVFITPRMPSATEETVFRQAMAMMAAIEANYLTQDLLDHPAVIEIIHPLTRSAEDLVKAFRRLASLINWARSDLGARLNPEDMRIIPLFEDIDSLLNADRIVEVFVEKSITRDYLRVFLGRSDPAMSSGLIASALAVKIAISRLNKLHIKIDLPIYPILGVGSLPFRGHLTPKNGENVVKEYPGIRTITIQSALRYDYSHSEVTKLISFLKHTLPQHRPLRFSSSEEEMLEHILRKAASHYRELVSRLSGIVNRVAEFIPEQRDRLPPSGALHYHRALTEGKLTLPRVIKLTAAFYTIGLPPEFIGTGRTLKALSPEEKKALLETYPSLRSDLERAAHFLDLEGAKRFIGEENAKLVERDIQYAEEALGISLLDKLDEEYAQHLSLAQQYLSIILHKPSEGILKDAKRIFLKLGVLRGGLG